MNADPRSSALIRGFISFELEQVPELFFFGAQVICGVFGGVDLDRYALHNLQSRLFECLKLQWVIRDDFHAAKSEVEENLCTLPVVSQVNRQTELLVRFNSVRALILKGVGANLVDDPDAATFLLLVDDRSPAFLLNHLHSPVELAPAIAFGRAKDVAGQTLRVDANKRWHLASHLSFKEDNKFFLRSDGAISRDLKLAPFSRQMSNCNPLDRFRL